MGRNRAISIGINKYEFLASLKYAKRDAELMQEFLRGASFEQVFFFSDDSPGFQGISTRPSGNNLRRFLRRLSENLVMEAGDNLCFFFSGHGMQHDGCDYLMPCDGDSEDVERTAIPIDFVTECLRGCGAGNVVLMLDACRYQESKSGLGIGNKTAEIARQQGVITFFSCSPNQLSYEIETLQQGIFTKAVLEGLGIQGKYATVGRLDRYLSARVPELIREHKGEQVRQTPYCIAESVTQYNLIICPQYARFPEISILKNDACEAEFHKDYDLAEQLWIQVLAVSPKDKQAINGIQKIAAQIENERYSQENSVSSNVANKSASPLSPKSTPVTNSIPTEADVPLKSERGIDYTNLRDLLATKKWAEADHETHGIMLLIAGKEKVGYFDIMDIQKHFCEDFRVINQLWLEYSNGRFGFSVQKCIRDEIKENLYKFLDRVGWDLDWGTCGYGGTRQTFPKGNFPARWFFSWYASVGKDLGMARIHGTEDMLWMSLDCF